MGTDFVTLEHESLFRTTLFRSSDCGKWCRIVSSYERRKKKKKRVGPTPYSSATCPFKSPLQCKVERSFHHINASDSLLCTLHLFIYFKNFGNKKNNNKNKK